MFSEIEPALLNGEYDAGLIIHENRFTYEAKGLKKIVDLGEFWESETGAPIPLGGIVVRRSLPDEVKQTVNRVLRRSVEYAFANPTASLPFVREHAQEMSEEVMYRHIDLYVNEYSVDLGAEGRRAVEMLFERAAASRHHPGVTSCFCGSRLLSARDLKNGVQSAARRRSGWPARLQDVGRLDLEDAVVAHGADRVPSRPAD